MADGRQAGWTPREEVYRLWKLVKDQSSSAFQATSVQKRGYEAEGGILINFVRHR